jgi:hypothetical protein
MAEDDGMRLQARKGTMAEARGNRGERGESGTVVTGCNYQP